MPVYTHTPPENPRGVALPVLRVAPGKVLNCLITSPDLIGTKTHYWHGRTTPCETPDCRPCQEGMPWRWHGYLGIWLPAPNQQYLLELTAQACYALLPYRATYHTLRGCNLLARRSTWAKNSRLVIETRPADLAKLRLPAPPHIERCLAVLWNLPLPALVAADRDIAGATLETLSDVAATSREIPIGPYAEALTHKALSAQPKNAREEG